MVLYAPKKPGISNWRICRKQLDRTSRQYQMNKTPDGNYWWLRITGLTPGTEYAFQYLVDGILKIADPYSEKILIHANDATIPAATYPGF